ncbi:adenylate/guanylate cyclase domain-containing protein [Synechococcus sp. PCC 7336]|uniref:adenylate/guanylate cyclase domain-containing protein n=1 Tax=Synechococcus sp. PCC 7336 TaxID=195250 RepID=UPI00037BF576|nr:adenylate/guanylate cyclase domain-containing protein [Synechococcus sp. PCC 7336]
MNDRITVLFADICNSTTLYETLGDRDAQRTIGASLMQMSAIVRDCNGKPLKLLGDGIMAAFDRPEDACRAACEMQAQLTDYFRAGSIRSGLRVGLNCGSAIAQDEDLFGDAVNIAARLAEDANVNQILTTRETIETLPPQWQEMTRPVGQLFVKGKREQVEAWQLIWQKEGLTIARFEVGTAKQTCAAIEVRLGDRTERVDRDRPSLTIGRVEENDLRVNRDLVSRQHVRIEFRRNKIVLIDRSTNGTFVYLDSEQPTFVRWEELVLKGSGWLGLGQEMSPEEPGAIQFLCSRSPEVSDRSH